MGYLLLKIIERKQNKEVDHNRIAYWAVGSIISNVVFVYWESRFGEFFSIAAGGGCYLGMQTHAKAYVLHLAGEKGGTWMTLITVTFGVGALVAPQIIRFFGVKSYLAYAGCYFIIFLLCSCFPSPEKSIATR